MNLTLGFLLIAALVLVGGWLTMRAMRAKRPLIKWPGAVLAGLLTLLSLILLVLAGLGLYRLYRPPVRPASELQVAVTPERVARGERLAYLCANCHASGGGPLLDGGTEDFTGGALGTLYAANLTPAGALAGWRDGEIVRAIREGVDRQGRALLIMPSKNFRGMSDEDAQALVAYLRNQPATGVPTPPTTLNFLGAAVIGAGVFPLYAEPLTGAVTAPPAGPTPEYGRYLVELALCGECHGAGLTGAGVSEFVTAGPNLPALLADWEEADFIQTMRTGIDPYGQTVDPIEMPWPQFSAALTDEELAAIFAYIRTLPG
jgi:mono/diheme cytochrome c family protein